MNVVDEIKSNNDTFINSIKLLSIKICLIFSKKLIPPFLTPITIIQVIRINKKRKSIIIPKIYFANNISLTDFGIILSNKNVFLLNVSITFLVPAKYDPKNEKNSNIYIARTIKIEKKLFVFSSIGIIRNNKHIIPATINHKLLL